MLRMVNLNEKIIVVNVTVMLEPNISCLLNQKWTLNGL